MCRVTMGHLRVNIGHPRVIVGHPRVKVDKFLNIRIVSGEFIFILQMFTLQIVDKSTSYTFKIVN